MTWLRVLRSRLAALFRKGRLEQELDEELRSHLEMLVEENLRKGMSPRRGALRGAAELWRGRAGEGNLPRAKGAAHDRDTGSRPALRRADLA